MKFTGKTAALHTLGCKVNEYETDAMRACLEHAGFSIVDFRQKADVYVINTCSVTNIADRKSRQMISRARKMNPDAVLVAAGCYVQTALDKTGKTVDADILLGSGRKSRLVEELERYFAAMERAQCDPDNPPLASPDPSVTGGLRASQKRNLSDGIHDPEYEALSVPRIEGHTRAWIKVQDGCNMFCSYCIIPYARGRIRSRRIEDVLRELENLSAQGIREVVLTGIHLSSYGVDMHPGGLSGEDGLMWQERSKLIDLIEAVSQIGGITRVRLGSLEPTIITEETVSRLSRIPQVCPHFHLSLQSGCDSVLKRMNRHYTTRDYKKSLDLLRAAYDNPAITTDVIVGFPGETQEEFDSTRGFLEEIQLYETHLFRYSMRAGTRAARMPDQIPESVKEERLSALSAVDRKMRERFEQSWDGREVEALFEETVQIGENGTVCSPNSDRSGHLAADLIPKMGEGEKLYTGYTREYIRVYAPSAEDLRGRIVKGTLNGAVIRLSASVRQ